jgi:drug/metabolite transporter (DMT)-like permease
MFFILLGALLFIVGVVFVVIQPLRGRLSRARSTGPAAQSKTLEPERPGKGMDMRSNWPGLAMMALGALLMLAGIAGF